MIFFSISLIRLVFVMVLNETITLTGWQDETTVVFIAFPYFSVNRSSLKSHGAMSHDSVNQYRFLAGSRKRSTAAGFMNIHDRVKTRLFISIGIYRNQQQKTGI